MTSNKPIKLLRPVAKLIANTVATNWVWKNRKKLIDRIATARRRKSKNKSKSAIDTTRPVGDLYVAPVAAEPPSAFVVAMADSGPPVSIAVRVHLEDAASHVHIVETPAASPQPRRSA